MLSQGASKVNISLAVLDADAEEGRIIHYEFFRHRRGGGMRSRKWPGRGHKLEGTRSRLLARSEARQTPHKLRADFGGYFVERRRIHQFQREGHLRGDALLCGLFVNIVLFRLF